MSFLRSLLRRFARDEKGSLVVEAIIVMPMFVWAYAGLFVYWDAYRSINTVQKASYTISDLISRSQASVNDAYIAGMATTFNTLAGSGIAMRLFFPVLLAERLQRKQQQM
jgi:Flp pilus assembly protein TadG